MKGFDAVGIVKFIEGLVVNDSNTLPFGNNLYKITVVTITAGIVSKYAPTPEHTYNKMEKYVEKRTTEFSASAVVISFVGTNLLHVSEVNNIAGSLNQKFSDILFFIVSFYHAVSSVNELTFVDDELLGNFQA